MARLVITSCVGLLLASAAFTQPAPLVPNAKESQLIGGVYLAKNPDHPAVLEKLHKAIADAKWEDAARAVQVLIDSDPSHVVEVKRVGLKEMTHWVGANAEGSRLLASFPKEGRAAYQKLFAPDAAKLLARIKNKFALG